MKNAYIILASFFIIAGCATGPKLIGTPKDIEKDNLGNYWSEAPGFKEFRSSLIGYDGDCKILSEHQVTGNEAHVVYRFLIDSNGEIHSREYVAKSSGLDLSLEALNLQADSQKLIDGNSYVPAPGNEIRIPVYVSTKLYIVDSESSCKF